MPNFNIIRETKPVKSFRVASVMGKFDLQNNHIKEEFIGEIDLTKDWQIGIIFGRSGTGKTTIAKEMEMAFQENNVEPRIQQVIKNAVVGVRHPRGIFQI